MRNEYIEKSILERYNIKEWHTPNEVDTAINQNQGTILVFVDSSCGCAASVARPALAMALENSKRPNRIATVFASSDREATAKVREYFTNQEPSSPSFALLRGSKFLGMVHRSDIKNSTPTDVAQLLIGMFDEYCSPDVMAN